MTTFTAHPSAPDGLVQHLSSYDRTYFTRDSVVLCRNTAPLIDFAYNLLRREISCAILGNEIGEQLCSLVRKCKPANIDDLLDKLNTWRDREVEKALKSNRSPEWVYDRVECLQMFIGRLQIQTIDSLLSTIERMFVNAAAVDVILATVHRAKGLEFNTVFLLDKSKYMPSKYAAKPWQRQQEMNLLYVAVTRSKNKLYFINSDCWSN